MIVRKKNQLYLFSHLVKTDIRRRYQGSIFGILWSLLVPLIMLVVYTVVFSEVFSAKWNVDTQNKFEFALMLFCGLGLYNLFSTVLGRSVGLIAENQNYVKKVVFPIEILPVVITVSALFECLISYVVLIIANAMIGGGLSVALLQVPLVLLPHIVFCVGVAYIFSAVSVYLKDIANIISVLITVCMYVSPVFFPLDAVPDKFRVLMMLNPMTYSIENMRLAIIRTTYIRLDFLFVSIVTALAVFGAGRWLFMRAKTGFADLL